MAEVWMDDYKKYFYLSRVELKGKEVGDLSKRKHLREELACHSFDWYLDNIIPHKYRMDRDSKLWGRLRSHKHPSLCIDHLQRDEAHKLKTYTLGKILIRLWQFPYDAHYFYSLSIRPISVPCLCWKFAILHIFQKWATS